MGKESQEEKKGLMVELEEAIEFAKDGIVSKTLMEEPQGKVVFFCFKSGQSLSAHTVSFPAAIFVLKGYGNIMIGQKAFPAKPGAWLYLPADVPHAVQATDDFVFLLHLFKS
jgi:quercetin dioxygenase-like cupin family protein